MSELRIIVLREASPESSIAHDMSAMLVPVYQWSLKQSSEQADSHYVEIPPTILQLVSSLLDLDPHIESVVPT